jgi:hypothetical protein
MTFHEVLSLFARYLHRIGDVDVVQMAGLAMGTTTTKLKTVNAIVVNLYNQQVSKTATDNIDVTACEEQDANTFCYYLVSINLGGAILVTKGTNNTYALPATPQGYVPIGAFKIATDESQTFTAGTTAFDAEGITAIFHDIDTGIAASLVNQAMRRLERGVTVNINGYSITVSNWDTMKVRTALTINQGDHTLINPIPNYKELISAQLTDSNSFTYPPLKKEDRLFLGFSTTQGRPLKISRLPRTETSLTPDAVPTQDFELWPQSDATYTLNMIAYQYSSPLDGVIYTSNGWTEKAPEALVFGALVEAAPYLSQDERLGTWRGELQQVLEGLYSSEKSERYAGFLLNIRPVDPFRRMVGNIYSFTDGEEW